MKYEKYKVTKIVWIPPSPSTERQKRKMIKDYEESGDSRVVRIEKLKKVM